MPLVASVELLHADRHPELSVFIQLIVASAPATALGTELPVGEARICYRLFVTLCKAGDTNDRCRRSDFDD